MVSKRSSGSCSNGTVSIDQTGRKPAHKIRLPESLCHTIQLVSCCSGNRKVFRGGDTADAVR